MNPWPFNLLLRLWALGALCSAAAHLIAPAWTAAGTTWALSPHWQQEIAYFDLFAAALFAWVARQPSLALKWRTTVLLCGLSLLLGLNHLSGWLHEARVFHVMFSLANFMTVAWGMAALGLAWRRQALLPTQE
ncbi:MAG: hypothetical protein JO171_04030 [Paludibacterium sp.]|uniref:hypothetical protein n=1 Tax=Paludibacterium sp. TaxID=1917523 RepID=UPI0025F1A019|nr:hypothetical protein [Paludibacterium sp.]MBV8046293.1 hypothetical protein [Paludibacterium sp.]MBV8647708.1 hypothetical protein [Paludibacterium sp.]